MKLLSFAAASLLLSTTAAAQIVYKCPKAHGTWEYANGASVPSGCKKVDIEAAPVVTVPAPKAGQGDGGKAAKSPPDFPKVDTNTQRARDDDRRKLLQAELQTQEDKLAALRKEYNNGEPERRGDERNYQKYLDRVEQLRTDIARAEANVASVKRELAQLRD